MVEHGVVGGVPLLQAGGRHAGQVAHAAVVRPAPEGLRVRQYIYNTVHVYTYIYNTSIK